MADHPMFGVGGKPIFGPGGAPLLCDGVPCCCDCETDGPAALFSYERTSLDPCTFDFTDDSMAGPCGAIVAWEWKIEGESPFSTAQNPTGIELGGSGPWDVTLTVTDAAGCQDSITQSVVCCDCAEDGPVADFSYEQTADSPCTFAFTDESVAGACGDIVSWLWNFGDGNTSTSQNPTHAYSSTGPGSSHTVTLTVTDSFGCEDSVSGGVLCLRLGCCDDGVPETVTVVVASVTNAGCAPGSCLPFNGTHVLTYTGTSGGFCEFVKALGEVCTDFGQTAVRARINNTSMVVILDTRYAGGGGDDHRYTKTTPSGVCTGTHTLNYSTGASISCNYPSTVQLTV